MPVAYTWGHTFIGSHSRVLDGAPVVQRPVKVLDG
jgi:hypothetical protein